MQLRGMKYHRFSLSYFRKTPAFLWRGKYVKLIQFIHGIIIKVYKLDFGDLRSIENIKKD